MTAIFITILVLICGGMFAYLVALIYAMVKGASDGFAKAKAENSGLISFNDGTLYLYKRDASVGKHVQMKNERDDYYAQTEKEVIYTSVSGGGVTVGGFDTIGGKTVKVSGKKTDRYTLQYYGQIINNIKLSDELYNEALNSPIEKYLNKSEKLINVNHPGSISPFMAPIMSTMSTAEIRNTALRAERAGYPDYTKARTILRWICAG